MTEPRIHQLAGDSPKAARDGLGDPPGPGPDLSEVPEEEDVSASDAAERLDQDPEEIPNRTDVPAGELPEDQVEDEADE